MAFHLPNTTEATSATSSISSTITTAAPTPSALPATLRYALANRFTAAQLAGFTDHLRGPIPLFVYGSLMLPGQVARIVPSRSAAGFAACMTPALLRGHERLAVHGADFPAVVAMEAVDGADNDAERAKNGADREDEMKKGGEENEKVRRKNAEKMDEKGANAEAGPPPKRPDTAVAGLLLCGLHTKERQRIESYEGGLYLPTRVTVQVEVLDLAAGVEKRGQRNVEAEVFLWGGVRGELSLLSEREWSVAGFLKSRMGAGLEEVEV